MYFKNCTVPAVQLLLYLYFNVETLVKVILELLHFVDDWCLLEETF